MCTMNIYLSLKPVDLLTRRCTCQVHASSCNEWDVMLMMVHKDGCFVTKQDATPEAYYTGGRPSNIHLIHPSLVRHSCRTKGSYPLV